VSPALSDLPIRKVTRVIESLGFAYVRTKGSHAVYRHPDGRAVVIPQHGHRQARHFNELAGADFALPRFLVLVIVPDDWVDYATASPDSVHLKYAAYWRSLRDDDRVNVAPDTKVRVPVPRANLLNVDALRAMMHDEPKRREA